MIHRDLKLEDILFADKEENLPLKAIDIGFPIFFNPGERFSETAGSPCYMAPELVKRTYGPEKICGVLGLFSIFCYVEPSLLGRGLHKPFLVDLLSVNPGQMFQKVPRIWPSIVGA